MSAEMYWMILAIVNFISTMVAWTFHVKCKRLYRKDVERLREVNENLRKRKSRTIK